MTAELRARFAADAASVPGVRRFVADGLTAWGRRTLVDDAELCVSELAANAALHSASSFMEVSLRAVDDAVRISVADDGNTPAEAVMPRPDFPGPDVEADELTPEDEPTTGRGLAIVSILASDWGVEQFERGKRIWVDLTESAGEHDVRPPRTVEQPSRPPAPGAAELPEGWVQVTLAGCPVELSLRQDEHLDELVRELQLMEADQENPRSRQLASELRGLLSGPAHARHTGRRLAQEAAHNGLEAIDVQMAMPADFSAEVRQLELAVKAADQLCEDMRLLTLASPPEIRELRAWMTDQLVQQIEHGAEPVSWDEWRDRSHGQPT